jgi:hypothetical protein
MIFLTTHEPVRSFTLENVSVVLVHGAWADGSSWAKVIGPLTGDGVRALAAPLPLTSFAEDTAYVGANFGTGGSSRSRVRWGRNRGNTE